MLDILKPWNEKKLSSKISTVIFVGFMLYILAIIAYDMTINKYEPPTDADFDRTFEAESAARRYVIDELENPKTAVFFEEETSTDGKRKYESRIEVGFENDAGQKEKEKYVVDVKYIGDEEDEDEWDKNKNWELMNITTTW